ncbi:MAG: DUF1523 family protein [Vibrionaceae bacterium]
MISKKFKKPAFIAIALLALTSALWLDFYLPTKMIANITGVEVKLTDKDGPISKKNVADGPTTDVYYIYTEQPGEKIAVFRNEDTGWGWPFYIKFDSADVQGKAKSLESDKRPALITAYGWRINMFAMFPNVTEIKTAHDDSSTWSIRRTIGLLIWFAGFGALTFFAWRYFNKKA